MTPSGSVTAEELVRALSRRETTLPAEIGAFIVLEACESMLAQGPRDVAALRHVLITAAGRVVLSGAACDEELGARSLRGVHAALLMAAGPGRAHASLPPPPSDGALTLRALHDQLEASLVPLNRNASRRVLARLAREAAQPPSVREAVDPAISSLLGVGAHPANDVGAPPRAERMQAGDPSSFHVDLFEGLALDPDTFEPDGAPLRDSRRPSTQALGTAATRSLRPSFAPKQAPETFHSLRARADDLADEESALPGSRKLFLGFSFVALAAAAVALAVSVRSPGDDTLTALPALDRDLAQGSVGELTVRATQPNAQVLVRIGAAPLEVANLPVGRPHEFVATAEGHRPARVLIPADAAWEASPTGPRYEVALQLEPESAPGGTLTLGPSRLPEPAIGGKAAEQGSVRVVTTPRGAQVYQLLGFASPVLSVQQLPIADEQELLIYREGFRPEHRKLAREDFKAQGGRRVAELDVALVPR